MTLKREKAVGPGTVYSQYQFVTNGVLGTNVWTNKGESYHRYAHTGYNTPHYRALKESGKIIPTTYWHQIEYEANASQSLHITRSGPGWSQDQTLVGNGNACGDALGDVANVGAYRSLLDESMDAQIYVDASASRIYSSGWDTFTFLAELGKTAYMIRNVAKSLLDLTKEWATVTKQTQVTLNAWLEGRYGWRLLVYDIIDVNNAIQGLSENQRKRFKHRTGRTQRIQTTETIPDFYWGHAWHSMTFSNVWEVSVRGSIIADISPPRFAFNPVVTAWELIPYSFVIDWILGVGTWLEQLSFLTLETTYAAAAGVHVAYSRELVSHNYWFLPEDSVQIAWEGDHESSMSGKGSLTVRTPASVSNLPHFNVRIDGYKVLDLVALVFQALRRL